MDWGKAKSILIGGKMELGDGVESYNAANPFGGGADTCIIAKNQFDKTDGVKDLRLCIRRA